MGRASIAAFAICSLFATRAPADVVFDSTLGTPGPAPAGVIGTTPVDYRIGAERGQLRGGNLFFSFEEFSIEPGLVGAFDRPLEGEVANVLARVTGGDVSRIDGTLGSAIPGADVWLINPSGILFGAGARLALGGALYLSTGSYVRHADGSRFSAAGVDASPLSVAAPEAFGFLDRASGAIDIDVSGNVLRGRASERLALVGGDVTIHAGTDDQIGFLWAPNARVDLVAIASAGTAPAEVALFDGGEAELHLSGPWTGGEVRIERDAVLSTSGVNPSGGLGAFQQGGGDLHVAAGSMLVDDAEVATFTGGRDDGGDIDIQLSGDLVLRARDDQAAGLFAGTGVTIGDDVLVGAGNGGTISVDAANITVLDGARFSTGSIWIGAAGSIELDARDSIRILGRNSAGVPSALLSNTTVSGAGGRIHVAADRLEMDAGTIVAETSGAGTGGAIDVAVGELSLRGNARIDSSTRSATDPSAAGGMIHVRASRKISISGRESDEDFSGITAIAHGESTARAGDITVQTPRLSITKGGAISTQALGSGDGGSIEVWTNELTLDRGLISASALEGRGGDVSIHASRRVALRGGSRIEARAEGAGDAGTIALAAGDELVLEDSAITTDAALADGGDVTIRARELVALERSEVSTSVTGGTGGNIAIDPEHVVLNESRIVARAGAGTGGNIRIVAGQFLADVDSAVDASSETGIDGTVQITSPDVDLTGTLDVLPAEFADPAELMRQACAAQRQAGDGSFVVATTARASAAPDGPLDAGGAPADESDCR
jgi:filamentous hemagglutinin family protein